MEKKNSLKSLKYIVLAVFAVLAAVSVLLMGKVRINYNISDYLDEDTDTKISLGIMENEFDFISNVQVMISDIGVEEAKEVQSKLKGINHVKFVNFDSRSTDYYKDNTALFVILVEGNEYSETAKTALADIRSTLEADYGARMELGGVVMEKQLLREAIQGEIVMILAISLCLVALLMLFTARSWLEPIVLLAAAGVAVLINMGTNVIFGEISYITNAVAAILQLALSMDYSIVLLHAYRDKKQTESDNERAMLSAVKYVVRPISASSLTTIAGLLALLFMSFTIGFDIGIVLMKSIVISAIASLTLLPAFLLLFDKLMQKTAKKPLLLKGEKLANISLKGGKIIVPIAVLVIAAGCVLNTFNEFSFTDSSNSNKKIGEKFGESGTLITLYKNTENAAEKEALLAEFLESYRLENGTPVLKSQVSYSSTIGQVFDVEKASRDLGISIEDAKLLFTVYRFEEENSAVKLSNDEFVSFALYLIGNDEEAKGFVDDPKLLELLSAAKDLYENEYSAQELIARLSSFELMEDPKLIELAVNQMYGNKFYDKITDKKASLEDMLKHVKDEDYLDEETVAQIDELLKLKETIKALQLPKPDDTIVRYDKTNTNNSNVKPAYNADGSYNFEAFWERVKKVIKEETDISLDDLKTELNLPIDLGKYGNVWTTALGLKANQKISGKDMFAAFFSRIDYFSGMLGALLPEESKELLDNEIFDSIGAEDYVHLYGMLTGVINTFEERGTQADLIDNINGLISNFNGIKHLIPEEYSESLDVIPEEIPAETDFIFKQLYIMYYGADGRIPEDRARLVDMIDIAVEITDCVIALSESTYEIKSALPEGTTELLQNVKKDILAFDGLLKDETSRSYDEMCENLATFIAGIKTAEIPVEIPEVMIMGVYVKYASANDLIETGKIAATDLLAFVLDAADNNELLSGRIDDDMKTVIKESEEKMKSAEGLLVGNNYSRMLLTVNLPPESAESLKFVNELSAKVHEIFGDDAYVAGEIATTNDLKNAFDDDNTLISIFTVVSIFVIILVVFRSLSLPIILVAVIQGAIWIAMAMSLVTDPMFFMSYIMSMCILMGATIDYGILLSTNYIRNRAIMDKKEALYKSLESALPTVFTSGLILMICGLVVGFIATQTSISSVGFLLFRGTLVSVVMVLLVLPALLYLLDSFVMKLTMKKKHSVKEESENN